MISFKSGISGIGINVFSLSSYRAVGFSQIGGGAKVRVFQKRLALWVVVATVSGS